MSATRPISTLPLPRSTISALSRAGYETTDELSLSTPEDLAKDLHVPLPQSQAILFASQQILSTQSAASLLNSSTLIFRCCPPVDKLLGGGLPRGHILELSSPPGVPKGTLASNLIQTFVEHGEEVFLIDPQNMITPGTLNRVLRQESSSLPSHYKRLVHILDVSTLHQLMAFIHNLPSFFDANPNVTLLVLSSLSFFFQTPPSSVNPITWRRTLLDRIKPVLAKVCSGQKLTILITSQLATKMVRPDGTNANFDTGSKAVMVPYLSDPHLPSSRTYRIIIVPESRTTGTMRLTGCPSNPTGKGPFPEERYRMVDEKMQMYSYTK